MRKNITRLSLVALAITALTLTLGAPLANAQRAEHLTISWNINLHGAPVNGVTPIGNASYDVEHGGQRFEADCDNVNLPNGTKLDVFVNGKKVGTETLLDMGAAMALTGKRVPPITRGTTVSINYQNGPAIVSGKF